MPAYLLRRYWVPAAELRWPGACAVACCWAPCAVRPQLMAHAQVASSAPAVEHGAQAWASCCAGGPDCAAVRAGPGQPACLQAQSMWGGLTLPGASAQQSESYQKDWHVCNLHSSAPALLSLVLSAQTHRKTSLTVISEQMGARFAVGWPFSWHMARPSTRAVPRCSLARPGIAGEGSTCAQQQRGRAAGHLAWQSPACGGRSQAAVQGVCQGACQGACQVA